MFALMAPAKINLTLEVLGKRPDGFHEIRSVLQTVNLCDRISFQPSQKISFQCDKSGWTAELSLVNRSVKLLQEATGCSSGAKIEVTKRVPLLSGLGGDSSDAAATLRGLNHFWGLGLTQEKLLELSAQLGSDVPFFIWGGTALAEGRGEVVAPLPPLADRWVVLVVPRVSRESGKTARLYASLKPGHYTDGHITRRLAEVLIARREIRSSMLFNTFENVAFKLNSELNKVYREHIIKLGAPHVHLAGSGPTLFTMLKDKTQADDLLIRCQNQGMEAYRVGIGEKP
ncbi:4-(cytidine 5'-diphospho)-2-C-methyl-D-erythritol kinase [Chloroflexota bacterium]